LTKFTVFCAQRSGSNYLQKLIEDNYENCTSLEFKHTKRQWKHASFSPVWNKEIDFGILLAKHPIKWVNSCMRFNADMWKWWGVSMSSEWEVTDEFDRDLYFEYKGRHVSIPKMVDRWNKHYNSWMEHSKCKFVWYPDLLEDRSRTVILDEIALENNLTHKPGFVDPKRVQHSDEFTDAKRARELDLNDNDMLNDKPHIIQYINDNIDNKLLDKMMSLSYENRSCI